MSPIELQPADVDRLLEEHRRFFYSKQTLSIDFRIEQLKKLRAGILRFEDRINEALRLDLGKHPFETYTSEVGFVLSSIRHTIKHIRKWAKPKRAATPIYLQPAKSSIIYEPYGTVLIIGPYNYPFQLLIEPLVGAIAAGNGAVLKPSELVPNTAGVIKEMIEATFDSSYVRTVQGGVETNTSLFHASFDYIFFTGSVPVGKIVMAAAAKNLVPVTLELGGKSPVIVDESANLKIAAQRIVWGKMLNSGQTCVAPDYLLVHESVKEPLLNEMIAAIRQFYGTDIAQSNDFGRIVNTRHFHRLKAILDQDKSEIIYGGNTDEQNRLIEPTLTAATWESASMADEIFGPILPVISYARLDDAIASIKKLAKPLALYLFTANKHTEQKVLAEVSSGGVSINDTITHLANPELPFGGVGSSGIGSYHGRFSFSTFSHARSVLKKSNKIHLTLLFPPYSARTLELVRKLLK
ncbi:aldehyde dehydrogenase [Paenibacillus sp. NEAU-GSW1]|uniref:aldehyde dehydrogenase n=1 Tax=Paenibacillus sp. NEAU-GSW1 TaxID=2682486 RepID=UPI0012E2839D|nr:aldehyde dehydrogenase [Paenibacillus sp. NEAU-GSW1]MUT65391.1 aldehyde dehydrogenase family protein [Paenibacillus sp. NEAU-GSW1]